MPQKWNISPPQEADPQEIKRIADASNAPRIPIDKITIMENYPFDKYDNFRFNDLAEDIRRNGVITPIIVRVKGDGYEILDGFNRLEAAKTAGYSEIPAVTLECPDDGAALHIAYTSNISQRSLKDLPLSKQAKIIADYYNSIKQQGRREDLRRRVGKGMQEMNDELVRLYKANVGRKSLKKSGDLSQKYEPLDTREKVAKEFGYTGRNLARFVSVNKLIDSLKERMDAKNIGFTVAVELSFLNELQQGFVEDLLAAGGKINVKKAGVLRKMARRKSAAASRALTRENIQRVISGREKKEKKEEAKTPRIVPFAILSETQDSETKYKKINVKKFLGEKFPKFFPENTEALEDEDVFIRCLIDFFVRISDEACYFFPKFFTAADSYSETLIKLYDAVFLHYDGLAVES